VYESDLFKLPGQIFAMHADGTDRHQLTDPTVGASSRADVVVRRPADRLHVEPRHTAVSTMAADGTHQARLTREAGFDGFPRPGLVK
jgi:hypothetical protein